MQDRDPRTGHQRSQQRASIPDPRHQNARHNPQHDAQHANQRHQKPQRGPGIGLKRRQPVEYDADFAVLRGRSQPGCP